MGSYKDLTGLVYGQLTVIGINRKAPGGDRLWDCKCSCGSTAVCYGGNLKRGNVTNCGCLSFKDMSNKRYGRLVAIKPVGRTKKRGLVWLFKCDCGNQKEIDGYPVRRGVTVSCGCYQKEDFTSRLTTHGLSRSLEYKVWNSMRHRCKSLKDGGHPRYGGRGIKVCDRWKTSFINFHEDMGPRPKGGTIERKDNDGNYEPSNCHWADRTIQLLNQGLRVDSSTGVKGVYKLKRGKFKAHLTVYGETVLNKEFNVFKDAVKARKDAEEKFIGPLFL